MHIICGYCFVSDNVFNLLGQKLLNMNKNNKNKMKFLFIFMKIENCIYIGKSDSNFKEGRDDIFINDILS